MFLAYLTIRGKENGSDIVYTHNASGEKYTVGKVGEWISLQFRVYENKLEVIADETLVGTFEGTWKSAAAVATSAYDNLQVTVCMQNKGDYYFDNLYLYHICDSELGGSDDEPKQQGSEVPFYVACGALALLSVASIAIVVIIRVKEKK